MKSVVAVATFVAASFSASSAFAQNATQFSGPYVGVVAGVQQTKAVAHDGNDYLTYGDLTDSRTNAVFGGEIGYNHQVGSFVVGLEGDLTLANAKTRSEGWDVGYYAASKQLWHGSVRTRVGIAAGNAMPFITGGVAFARTRFEANDGVAKAGACAAASTTNAWVCETKNQTGFEIGGGVEAKLLANVSVKAEYLHTQLQSKSVYIYGVSPIQFSNSSDAVRVGMNYHF